MYMETWWGLLIWYSSLNSKYLEFNIKPAGIFRTIHNKCFICINKITYSIASLYIKYNSSKYIQLMIFCQHQFVAKKNWILIEDLEQQFCATFPEYLQNQINFTSLLSLLIVQFYVITIYRLDRYSLSYQFVGKSTG